MSFKSIYHKDISHEITHYCNMLDNSDNNGIKIEFLKNLLKDILVNYFFLKNGEVYRVRLNEIRLNEYNENKKINHIVFMKNENKTFSDHIITYLNVSPE